MCPICDDGHGRRSEVEESTPSHKSGVRDDSLELEMLWRELRALYVFVEGQGQEKR